MHKDRRDIEDILALSVVLISSEGKLWLNMSPWINVEYYELFYSENQ